jgi:hypothetical protein
MTRTEVLDKAKEIVVGAREGEYGSPRRNFERIAALWSAHLGDRTLTPVDVALMMALLKIARLASAPGHDDSWTDLAGYAACGAECALK